MISSGAASYVDELGRNAKTASRSIASVSTSVKDDALLAAADGLTASMSILQEANGKDVAAATEAGLSSALIDRLTLTRERIEKMAKGVREIARLRDPVGEVIDGTIRPNGLKIERVRVPIGVIRRIQAPSFDAAMNEQIAEVTASLGKGDLRDVIYSRNTWKVE